jgi:hypothetical protein
LIERQSEPWVGRLHGVPARLVDANQAARIVKACRSVPIPSAREFFLSPKEFFFSPRKFIFTPRNLFFSP